MAVEKVDAAGSASAVQFEPHDTGTPCVAGCDSKHPSGCKTCPAKGSKLPFWSCAVCCKGCKTKKIDGGQYCDCGNGPPPPPPHGIPYIAAAPPLRCTLLAAVADPSASCKPGNDTLVHRLPGARSCAHRWHTEASGGEATPLVPGAPATPSPSCKADDQQAVTWRLSTEGNEWQLRTLERPEAASTRADAPSDVCTPIAGLDCWGNDIARHTGITSASDCCAQCKQTSGCGAWTFDTTASHAPLCFVKKSCGKCSGSQCTTNVSAVSGHGAPTPAQPGPLPPGVPLNVSVNTSDIGQTMAGFGGCFNEKGWDALSALSQTQRDGVMRMLFSDDGLRYNINRMPIGSSDFADNYYSLDDTQGDFEIARLNLTRDRQKLLPYIKAAMRVRPELRVWGSPWTGPEWMKDSAPQIGNNEGCGSLSSDPRMQAAYALYLAKAARAFRSEGLNLTHLAIQNEPNQGGTWDPRRKKCGNSYPKMHWTGSQLASFLKDHLGPTFAKEGLTGVVGLFLATFPVNAFDSFVKPALSDPDTLKYLAGVGLQYAGVGMIQQIKAVKPSLMTWETETPCGGGRAKVCGNGPGTNNNSWQWGEGQWGYMRSFIESGAEVYSQWNMVLDQTGLSGWHWSQCSPVTVHTDTKTVTYEGSYWATKHFSAVVDAGAVVLGTSGGDRCVEVNGACGCAKGCGSANAEDQFIAFKNPDGKVAIVGMNAGDAARPVRLIVDGRLVARVELPPHSMSSFIC